MKKTFPPATNLPEQRMLVKQSRTERASTTKHDWIPWAWCNLRRNPFGELTPAERVSVAVVDVSEIVAQVQHSQQAVQLIGDCGRGKTTRMLVLRETLADSAYVYLFENEPCPAIPSGRPLLIDEAQRLPRHVRRQVFASGLPLVLATHRDLRRPLVRSGYRVSTQEIGKTNDAALVHALANKRIEASRLTAHGAVPRLSMDDAHRLVNQFGSDIRAIESYLYEVVQTQVFSHGEMRFID
jgi:hypothetical protein